MSIDNVPGKGGQETQHQGNFRITVTNPDRIFRNVQQTYRDRFHFIPRPEELGLLKSDQGTFSEIETLILVVSPPHDGYYMTMDLTYRSLSSEYWSNSEIDELSGSLASGYRSTSPVHNTLHEGLHTLTVNDPQEGIQNVIMLGWGDEREKWKGQVMLTHRVLRAEAFPYERENFERSLQHLINSPKPLSESIPGAMLFCTGLDPEPIDLLSNMKLIKMKGQKDFNRKLEKWLVFADRAINIMSRIKKDPQRGKLNLVPED